ncbi:hypothetical protein DFJ73DRAFT_841754 [Zopfochytrium polystomum]|nr:hypothetical protein DFJ73DRAFT_841754 [Zopfochytrium polystomum]
MSLCCPSGAPPEQCVTLQTYEDAGKPSCASSTSTTKSDRIDASVDLFSTLPNELVGRILAFVDDHRSFGRLCCASKSWSTRAAADPHWRRLYLSRWRMPRVRKSGNEATDALAAVNPPPNARQATTGSLGSPANYPSPTAWKAFYAHRWSLHRRWRSGQPPVLRCLPLSALNVSAVNRDWIALRGLQRLQIVKRSDGSCLRTLHDLGLLNYTVVDPNGRGVLVASYAFSFFSRGLNPEPAKLKLVNAATGQYRLLLPWHQPTVRLLHLTKTRILAVCCIGKTTVWDRASGRLMHNYEPEDFDAVAVGAHSDHVAMLTRSSMIKLWNIDTGRQDTLATQVDIGGLQDEKLPLLEYDGYHIALHFPTSKGMSLDGSRLAALFCEENSAAKVLVWDLESGLKLHHIEISGLPPFRVTMDRLSVIAATRDSLRIWDFGTGTPFADDL